MSATETCIGCGEPIAWMQDATVWRDGAWSLGDWSSWAEHRAEHYTNVCSGRPLLGHAAATHEP